jgi:hypothetical protein
MKSFTRLGVVACTVYLSQIFGSGGSAHAVPKDVIAWNDIDEKITVFKDAVDENIFWFVPRIRFESSGGKTLLVPSTTADGKTQYTTRIIPYFTKDMRNLVEANIPNIRQDSQLLPVVAKNIGFNLPDFGFKFMSPSVTNYEYLDVPRLVRFSLNADDAALFNRLYSDDMGVTVEFSITYDGMLTDKFYNIDVSCKQIKNVLDSNIGGGASLGLPNGIVLGADLQRAFENTVGSSMNNVNIVSEGEVPGMADMLSRVMSTCFTPVDSTGYPATGGYYNPGGIYGSDANDPNCTNPNDTSAACGGTGSNTNPFGTGTGLGTGGLGDGTGTGGLGDGTGTGTGTNLLPKAALSAHYRYKSTSSDVDNQTVAKSVSLKTSESTTVIVDSMTSKASDVDSLQVTGAVDRKFTVTQNNASSTPYKTGIKIAGGQQVTISAAFVFAGSATATPAKAVWDTTWGNPNGDLYYRIGTGAWTAVNSRVVLASDVANGGELQFYLDRSAIFNAIPAQLRKAKNIFARPAYTIDSISPSFSVEVVDRRVVLN